MAGLTGKIGGMAGSENPIVDPRFTSIEIDRSNDQSIGCCKSSIRVDHKVRSRVVFSGNS